MKSIIASLICLASLNLAAKRAYLSEPYNVEKRILVLSLKLDKEMMALSSYKNLKEFCNDDDYRQTILGLLDHIHNYHDMLETDLNATPYDHSKRTIGRILSHMDKLDKKYNSSDFTGFLGSSAHFNPG